MKIFRKYRTLWMMGIIIVIAILFIIYFNQVLDGIGILFRAITSLLIGAALAFVLNLIMDPVEKKLLDSKNERLKKHARSIAILTSFLVMFAIIVIILSIIIPNLVSAVQMLTSEAPQYFTEMDSLVRKLLANYPSLAEKFSTTKIDWDQTFQTILNFVAKGSGTGNVMDSTMNLVSSFVGFFVNMFVVIVFASYVLSEKERFVKGYYTWIDLFVPQKRRSHMTRNLRIINQSFKSFIVGEIIEAAILSTMCMIGMAILQLPYATMVGILVGVINMIPMVGAFIGGGIGAFIIFTISPTKCLIFLVFLCVIQQIESNVFFPRVIGNKVGLPGIYVMMTIVVGGTLFGVTGMVLGVPLMASIYKILKIDLAEIKRKREEELAYKNSGQDGQDADHKPTMVDNVRSEMQELKKAVASAGRSPQAAASSASGTVHALEMDDSELSEIEQLEQIEDEVDPLIQADELLRQKIDALLVDEEQNQNSLTLNERACLIAAANARKKAAAAKNKTPQASNPDPKPKKQ